MALVKDLLEILSAGLVPALAVFGIYYARMQAQTAKDRVRLDNFDRRYLVFEAFRSFIKNVLQHAKVDEQAFHTFSISTADFGFLFGKEVTDYTKLFREKALEVLVAQGNLEGDLEEEQRLKFIRTKHQGVIWFHEQYEPIEKLFYPYLRLPKP